MDNQKTITSVWLSAYDRQDLKATYTATQEGIFDQDGNLVWKNTFGLINRYNQEEVRNSTLEAIPLKEVQHGSNS